VAATILNKWLSTGISQHLNKYAQGPCRRFNMGVGGVGWRKELGLKATWRKKGDVAA